MVLQLRHFHSITIATHIPLDELLPTKLNTTNGSNIKNVQAKDTNVQNGAKDSFFSACLLIKDDNKILPEWLAYHYTALPLRNLIVGLDPFSLTSPVPILDKFRELGMHVHVWNESYHFPGEYNNGTSQQHLLEAYEKRQRNFFKQCMKQLKQEKHGWTVFIDTDEYITFNPYRHDEGHAYRCTQKHEESDEKGLAVCNETYVNATIRTRLPNIGSSTISDFLASDDGKGWVDHHMFNKSKSCAVLPRVFFTTRSNITTHNKESAMHLVPEGFDVDEFRTFLYHDHSAWQSVNVGKSMVYAKKYIYDQKMKSPHVVGGKQNCFNGPFVKHDEFPLRVQHYQGSFEEFVRPGYLKKTPVFFEKIRQDWKFAPVGLDSSIEPWLTKFVELVGKEKALEVTLEARRWAFSNDATRFSQQV
eukprot:CAMPEP_0195537298 /NCGR_PEP_ID=MMETSP0794_2-20130614/47655_1 /TAXON_ID=515487 /ORGANISM="Stephanopyxis turris, Strain CCMP 815" /LENGTH=416 /DNA_ID=CAMNT_0040670973 /DNA_START=90 /DNA_END=1340 /DNA_ORIENTATION=-